MLQGTTWHKSPCQTVDDVWQTLDLHSRAGTKLRVVKVGLVLVHSVDGAKYGLSALSVHVSIIAMLRSDHPRHRSLRPSH